MHVFSFYLSSHISECEFVLKIKDVLLEQKTLWTVDFGKVYYMILWRQVVDSFSFFLFLLFFLAITFLVNYLFLESLF